MAGSLVFFGIMAALGLEAGPIGTEAGRLEFTVTPAAAGRQLVRSSLPMPPGSMREGQGLLVSDGKGEISAAVRVLTWHEGASDTGRSARRSLVTFPYSFASREPVSFVARAVPGARPVDDPLPVQVEVDGSTVAIDYRGGPRLTARLLAPARAAEAAPSIETVESNPYYLWRRVRQPDPRWPCVIEVRIDAAGGVVLVAHLQRSLLGDGYAPELGWQMETFAPPGRLRLGGNTNATADVPFRQPFDRHVAASFFFDRDRYRIDHPAAPFKGRGSVEVRQTGDRGFVYRYLLCAESEKVPMQQSAWRRSEVVIAPSHLAPPTPTLESPHEERLDWRAWDALYDTGPPLDLSTQPELAALLRYHHDAIAHSAAVGDDWGNITSYSDGRGSGDPFGMNRLNHCPAIFEEAWRTGDRRLRDAAVNWCDNFHDLSIWWGPEKVGGTRYNNILAMDRTPPDGDRHFMWRSNGAVDFCTKGYASFLLAYEQTGDPRHLAALEAQVSYASRYVHADRGEARNIGDVEDFMRLYRYTGDRRHRDDALRLFRELRTKLSAGDLFSQAGQPIVPDPPFINDDQAGYAHPFAKPYIIGYALLGLPRLASVSPGEPKLSDVIRAVADFMADSQDPAGGWRYPHPRSSGLILSQAVEHAWQLVRADTLLGPQPRHVDAVERVLRQRYHGWKRTGHLAAGVTPWELVTGKVKDVSEIRRLYRHPDDRDFARDFTDGRISFGGSPPEGLVYFPGVLAYYLKHRPASRLLAPPAPDEPLGKLLSHVPATR